MYHFSYDGNVGYKLGINQVKLIWSLELESIPKLIWNSEDILFPKLRQNSIKVNSVSWGRGIKLNILMFSSAASIGNEIIKESLLFKILLKLRKSMCEGTVHLKSSVGR